LLHLPATIYLPKFYIIQSELCNIIPNLINNLIEISPLAPNMAEFKFSFNALDINSKPQKLFTIGYHTLVINKNNTLSLSFFTEL
jgi:hypothetical protein